jgi:C4-dicarboxylate transporter DctM subunit
MGSLKQVLHRFEDSLAGAALLVMAVLPITEALLRSTLGFGIPASTPIVQHLTLWVAFLGAALAAREDRMLAIGTAQLVPEGRPREITRIGTSFVAASISALLCMASIELVLVERQAGMTIGAGIQVWVTQLVLPFAFGMIALRLAWHASDRWGGRAVAGTGILVGFLIGLLSDAIAGGPRWPWVLLLVAAGLLGTPIFAVLGGAAALLLILDFGVAATVPAEAYSLNVSQYLPAIPLFTLTGFLLAEGKASERLFGVFRAVLGWCPGGTAVVTVAVCAFFTAFTGGSGVTILALGGLLLPSLLKEGYRENFSLGMLTASGSLGLLFPPALPLILYGVVAEVPIDNLFIGGIVPGILMVAMLGLWGLREGIVDRIPRERFSLPELGRAAWHGKFELAVPAVALGAIFSGRATIVEAAALTALYALVVQVLIHRDLKLTRDLPGVFQKCIVLLGGILIILGVAKGLSYYLVDAMIPGQLVDWAQTHIDSPIVFLLALNVFLLLVGCLMDIFSATMVVVPLILPLGAAFGIHPVHLGIIFIANLELGYLTPPVGLNLFISSYRFDRPLLQVYRAVVPMLLILAVGVLLITYVPSLTMGLLNLIGRGGSG